MCLQVGSVYTEVNQTIMAECWGVNSPKHYSNTVQLCNWNWWESCTLKLHLIYNHRETNPVWANYKESECCQFCLIAGETHIAQTYLAWCLFFLTVCSTWCVLVTPPSVTMKICLAREPHRGCLKIHRRGSSSSVPPRLACIWLANCMAFSTDHLVYSELVWKRCLKFDPKAITLK